ncbi:hypothetical protein GNF82_12130 [Clostridium perfringens]
MKNIHTLQALCEEIKALTGINDVFPSAFPSNANSECIVVTFTDGKPGKDTVMYASVKVVTRADTPNRAYDLAVEIEKYFTSFVDVRLLSADIVIQCRTQHPFPLFLGEDENRRHMYSMTYNIILSTE